MSASRPGACARGARAPGSDGTDLTLLRLERGDFEFADARGDTVKGSMRLVPGRVVSFRSRT